MDDRIEELLKKEENRELLDGLEQASRRVEMAQRELAEIEKQEIEAKITGDYINRLQSRATEIAECQKEILEARLMVEEAERSLMDRDANTNALAEMGNKVINQDMERLESIKAAFVSAVVGTVAELPISLTRVPVNSQLILPLAVTFFSCALFGVTFRYAVRRDLDNFQLKSGTSAAFGFVKGFGMLGQPMELDANTLSSTAVCVSENLLIFLFAGVALDFCFKLRVLSPFPAEESRINS